DDIVSERKCDPAGVTVVGNFVSGAIAERPANLRAIGRRSRKSVGVGPMFDVLQRGVGGVVFGKERPGTGSRRRERSCYPPASDPRPTGQIGLPGRASRGGGQCCLSAAQLLNNP